MIPTPAQPIYPADCPVGTRIYIGHPANKIHAVKTKHGGWRYLASGRKVEDEDFRAGWDVLK